MIESCIEAVENPKNRLVDRKKELEGQLLKDFDSNIFNELEDLMCFRDWKCADARQDTSFAKDESGMDELHFERRQFLRKHPMKKYLEKMRGTDGSTLWITVMACVNNLLVAYLWSKGDIPKHPILFVLSVILIGGSIQGLMGVIIHDAGHNLVSSKMWKNKLTMFIANIPMLFPVAFSFKRYHFMHHVYQGIEGKDPDIPLPFEIWLIRGRWWAKIIWISIYPFMYIIRGAAMGKEPSPMEIYNWIFVLIVDAIIFKFLGWNAIAFLAASTWFGYSYHPVAAHFIQEHYTFSDGQETYSYYGPLNSIFMNIGYHNEHHDQTGVPWRRLPLITALIPSFYYKKLDSHASWIKVHWDFITNNHMGPCSRVTRKGTGRIIKNE